ncbi:MAG: hypothetical protein K1X88_13500 [Nannocystaceae bacterium]|nr:hypothetical protein [Nannocystaceae bacterium]
MPKSLHTGSDDAALAITSPELDESGAFEFAGQTLRISFNAKVTAAPAAAGEAPGPRVTIEPAVAGVAKLVDATTLEFVAAAPFDPDAGYTVTLGGLRDEHGTPVFEGWHAEFRADPQVWIGGKMLSYLPKPGEPRVVAVEPSGGIEIGTRPSFEVLFDQPIEPRAALDLIGLHLGSDDGGDAVPLSARRGRRDVFAGIAVDRRHIVVFTPKRRLDPGAPVTLVRRDPGVAEYEQNTRFDVAERLSWTGVECWNSEVCRWSKGALALGGGSFAISYSNPIAAKDKDVPALVAIDPPVPNLSVWNDTWSSVGRINISGGFAPSQHYVVTVAPVRDRFGQQADAVSFTIDTDPLSASATMAEGNGALDLAEASRVPINTRNVARATLKLWRVGADAAALDDAETKLAQREMPPREPDASIELRPAGKRDADTVTLVDLASKLDVGHPWLVALQLDEPAHGAKVPSYPAWSSASRSPMRMVTIFDDRALAVHTQTTPDAVLVHVARLRGGEPVEGASLRVGDDALAGITTDKDGVAIVAMKTERSDGALLHVEHDGTHAQVRLGRGGSDASTLAPQYAGAAAEATPVRAMIVTDRGVYRPGSTIHFKGIARTVEGDALPPMKRAAVRLRVESPTGDLVYDEWGWTTDHGGYAGEFTTTAQAEIGRYTISLQPALHDGAAWTTTTVQVAEFEPPRFAVDVSAQVEREQLQGKVAGRYLFGAAMSGAQVSWTLSREATSLPEGDMVGRGLAFDPRRRDDSWYDEASEGGEGDGATAWQRSGETTLADDGTVALSQAIELPAGGGPQRFVLEATVQDESHRAIAARDDVVVFDAPRYAGVRITDGTLELAADGKTLVPLELGVADQQGNAIAGAEIEAVLERLDWERTRKPGAGGSWDEHWHIVRREVARCTATTTKAVVDCPLAITGGGDYVVTAFVDGRKGGSDSLWVWSPREDAAPQRPGRALEVVADKREYKAGDVARVEVTNPFREAIAIVTREGAGERHVERRRLERSDGAVAVFEVPITAEHAPTAYVTATVLPIDSDPSIALQWRWGAAKLPVSLGDARLELALRSDRPHYAPGERATIELEVSRGGAPVADAELALAVVDEGVLRLTDFHAPDPVAALRPAAGLSLRVIDNRDLLAEFVRRSQVAGDGGSEGDSSLVTTRKNFVQTALWRPDLVTDAEGRVRVELPLPDNLTRFRMMAVVLDDHGRGAVREEGFEVRKPLMVVPAVPRFAVVGDSFEAAAVVHNGTDAAMTATVTLGEASRTVELAAAGHARVAFATTATAAGPMAFRFDGASSDGSARDRVEVTIPVAAPGLDERPRIAGSFHGAQDVTLTVPDDVFPDEDQPDLQVTLGVALWPELGERVEYLVDYPHGCVEQTTSGTLPLLAARDLLPRLGFLRYSQAQLDERIQAGVDRLATMRTGDGGLAYWPGTYPSNPYGTAYAMRAIVRAKAAGATIPAGMLEGMTDYLTAQLQSNTSLYPGDLEVRTAIALSLSEAGALPPSAADSLVEHAKEQGTFGHATLALALATLPGERKRTDELLDRVEQAFAADGKLLSKAVSGEFAYYGSSARTRAQAALALVRLRPASPLGPTLLERIVEDTDSYTTQSTAFGLIALAEHLVHVTATPVELAVELDGQTLAADPIDSLRLGPGALRFRIPLTQLRGRTATLRLRGSGDAAIGFLVDARWRRPFAAVGTLAATSAKRGPDIFRVFTGPTGQTLDPAAIEPGDIVRVTLLARMPDGDTIDRDRIGYVALTDAIAAGFEPIQPDLASMTTVPGLDEKHALYEMLSWGAAEASYTALHDERVDLYFDRVWGEWVAASYLVRATTPGTFAVPPARVELMYEPDSLGYSDVAQLTVVPAARAGGAR